MCSTAGCPHKSQGLTAGTAGPPPVSHSVYLVPAPVSAWHCSATSTVNLARASPARPRALQCGTVCCRLPVRAEAGRAGADQDSGRGGGAAGGVALAGGARQSRHHLRLLRRQPHQRPLGPHRGPLHLWGDRDQHTGNIDIILVSTDTICVIVIALCGVH